MIFLGRNDNQVKIRGYRIELGEIESHLNQMEEIRDSVVIAKKGEQHESFLVAYFLKGEHVNDTGRIIDKLKTFLPVYMIPSYMIPLEKFPVTLNQKIDRKALSERSIESYANEKNVTAPLSYLEKKLSEYWQEVLKKKVPVGVNENFFAIGGHSLAAVRLMGLIAQNLLLDIPFKIIFDHPTIELQAKYLQQLNPTQFNTIPVAEHKDFYDLTPSQYNIWLASQKKDNAIAYHMFAAYKIDGIVDQEKITKAIVKIIAKYEILRTNFIEINAKPYQKIHSQQDFNFTISINELEDKRIDDIVNEFVTGEFNLETDLLIKVQLLHLRADKYMLIFCTHHLIMDGLSLEIFIRKFVENYNESVSMTPSNTIKPKLQFKDYSEWLNETLRINAIKNELFWTTYLKDYQPKYSFFRKLDTIENDQNGGNYQLAIGRKITSGLRRLALEEQITLYTVLITALNVLIYKFSKHNDICIGTVNAGRSAPELDKQIGMFAKTIILRTQISSEQTFVEILKNTHNHLLKTNENQDIPFNVIPRSTFDILLTYMETDVSFECIHGLSDFRLELYPIENKYSRLPIVFNLVLNDNKLEGSIDYNCDLFEQITIQMIASKFENLLTELVENPLLKMEPVESRWQSQNSPAFDFDFNF
jgi:hypothetical protein